MSEACKGQRAWARPRRVPALSRSCRDSVRASWRSLRRASRTVPVKVTIAPMRCFPYEEPRSPCRYRNRPLNADHGQPRYRRKGDLLCIRDGCRVAHVFDRLRPDRTVLLSKACVNSGPRVFSQPIRSATVEMLGSSMSRTRCRSCLSPRQSRGGHIAVLTRVRDDVPEGGTQI